MFAVLLCQSKYSFSATVQVSSGILTKEETHNAHNMLSDCECTSFATALPRGLQRLNTCHYYYFEWPYFPLLPILQSYIGYIFWNLECMKC